MHVSKVVTMTSLAVEFMRRHKNLDSLYPDTIIKLHSTSHPRFVSVCWQSVSKIEVKEGLVKLVGR